MLHKMLHILHNLNNNPKDFNDITLTFLQQYSIHIIGILKLPPYTSPHDICKTGIDACKHWVSFMDL